MAESRLRLIDDAPRAPGSDIDPTEPVERILKRFPAAAPILARHGLDTCCGGRHPLEMACRAHGVSLAEVAAEIRTAVLNDAASRPSQAQVEEASAPRRTAEENFYRRFLKAALLFTLTGGTTVGAMALLWMAARGRLGGLTRGEIQVHGHYQLVGWVGLFIVGIAYHILPRFTGVRLASYRWASVSFVALVTGTILRTAQPLGPGGLRSLLLVAGALLELLGVLIFLALVLASLPRRAREWEAYQRFVAAGTGWFAITAVMGAGQAVELARSGAFEVPPPLNLPYLTIFLLGFVTFWILGVSLRTLPVFMGLRAHPALASALVVPLCVSVGALAVAESFYLAGGGWVWRSIFAIGGLGTALCLALGVLSVGVLAPHAKDAERAPDRAYEKFIVVAYGWLLLSAALLAVFSLFALNGRPLDHALVGAYRHAITVGFISTMMVGMAFRIVPVFRGVPLWAPALREATFWLLGTGCVVRVLFQSLSTYGAPVWLRIAGISGVLELAAFVLFAVNLWKTLDASAPGETLATGMRPAIAPEANVGALLAAYPELLPVFVGHGFGPLANPMLRRTLARAVSVSQACRLHGVPMESFLARLSEAKLGQTGGRSHARDRELR